MMNINIKREQSFHVKELSQVLRRKRVSDSTIVDIIDILLELYELNHEACAMAVNDIKRMLDGKRTSGEGNTIVKILVGFCVGLANASRDNKDIKIFSKQ